jgi:hypothetical protein
MTDNICIVPRVVDFASSSQLIHHLWLVGRTTLRRDAELISRLVFRAVQRGLERRRTAERPV